MPTQQPITRIAPNPVTLAAPKDTERYLAATMHVATIFFPLLAPLIGYAVAGNSKYLREHSYQAIFEHVVLNVSLFVIGGASLIYTGVSLWHHYQTNWENFSIWPMLIRFAIGWILLAILEIVNTVYSIFQARNAFAGRWPKRIRNRAFPFPDRFLTY